VKHRLLIALTVLLAVLANPPSVLACAACYGQSDSALAQGMNWGIFTLLGVIGFVLVGVAGFFVFIIRRAATVAAQQAATPVSSTKV
jgi:heme/copper-type cytochrome/quinol oxidase subunit 2